MAIVYHKNYSTRIGLLDLPVAEAHNRKHNSCFAKLKAMNILVEGTLRDIKQTRP